MARNNKDRVMSSGESNHTMLLHTEKSTEERTHKKRMKCKTRGGGQEFIIITSMT